jgi:membrane-anchored glycerophosphoryl diester phosphodiesterase (GDPDase)
VLERRFGDAAGDRFGVVFAISLLSTAAILLGYCALIAPGVLLSVRWFSAIPIGLSGNLGAGDALRKSWQTTEGHGSAIFGVLLILYAPMILLLIAVVIAILNGVLITDEPAPLAAVAIDTVTNLTVVTSWYAAIAFLELRIPRKTALEEVFA